MVVVIGEGIRIVVYLTYLQSLKKLILFVMGSCF